MRKSYFNIILKCNLAIITLFTLSGCNDVFEKRLAGDKVTVIIPSDGDTLYSNEVHFKWDELDGADHYNLQIVKPSFSNIQTFEIDSNIADTEIKLVLSPGAYEFKLRGENSAYQSDYIAPRAFFVDSVNDLSNQAVQLLDPIDELYTNETEIDYFGWQNLFSASYYIFQIRNGTNFQGGSLIYEESNIYGINYNFYQSSGIGLSEGIYTWGIKAVNESSSSDFSTRLLYIDTTAPNTPLLTAPEDGFPSAGDEITFKWSKNGTDPGTVNSPLASVIEISIGDSLFTTGNTIIVDNIQPDSLVRQFPTSGDYWWRAYLTDGAGNASMYYSEIAKFNIP